MSLICVMGGAVPMDMIYTGLKTFSMLLIVLGFAVLALYLMRRLLLSRRASNGENLIKTVSSAYVSPKDRIQVLEVYGERFLIGISPGNITFLTRLGEREREGFKGNEREKQ